MLGGKSLRVLEVAKRRWQKRLSELLWVSIYLRRGRVLLARALLSREAPQHPVPPLKLMGWHQGRPRRMSRYRISLKTLSFPAHQVLSRKSSRNVEPSWKSASSRNRPTQLPVSISSLIALLPHIPLCQSSTGSRLTEIFSKFRSPIAP